MEDLVRLSVDIISYTYPDGTLALSEVSMRIKKGEFIGIIGSNGSGKTTLLRVMDGLYKDFKGSVLLDGVDIRKLTPKEIYKKMGLVFQNPDEQLFAPTVAEDVSFGPINMGFTKEDVEERVKKALKAVEMEGYGNKPIQNLSYGEKKRICIAGLLSMGHEILLLDEPTAGLDPMGEYKMMELLLKLNKRDSVTIVMATHSIDLIPLFLDKVYILNEGRVIKGGLPEDIFTTPAEMVDVKLRLPQIAELIYRLKNEDNLPFEKIPLTIGQAKREIIKLFTLKKI
ncbi:MAG: ATP-binding cassette domain-containing protein [Thermodesulfovibrionales bacterium]|nr:ATP-binding cassette domain-containing protein [Thermodesulfovibrionales bacterium]